MTALLDTSVLIGIESARLDVAEVPATGAISVVTLEELHLGILRSSPSAATGRRRTYDQAVRSFDVLSVDRDIAQACAHIRAEGRGRGVRYPPLDSLIGATARVHAMPLYTQDAGMLGMVGVDVRVV